MGKEQLLMFLKNKCKGKENQVKGSCFKGLSASAARPCKAGSASCGKTES